jgi:DNA-binding NarL/FixJ family response regulator
MIRIIIVDDQKVVTQGLKLLLEAESDIEVVGLGANGKDAIDLVLVHQPDVLLIDQHMPVMDGIEATRHILQDLPDLAILLLSASDDDTNIRNAMLAGAKGYLLKSTSGEDLARSIRAVHRGYSQMSPGLMEKLMTGANSRGSDFAAQPQSSSIDQALLDLLQNSTSLAPVAVARFLESIPDRQTAIACTQTLKTTLQRQPTHVTALYLTGSLVQRFQSHPQQALKLFQKALEESKRQSMPRTTLLEICRRAWNIDTNIAFKWLCDLLLSKFFASPQPFFQDLEQVFGAEALAYRKLVVFWQIRMLNDLCGQTDTFQSKLSSINNQRITKAVVSHSI